MSNQVWIESKIASLLSSHQEQESSPPMLDVAVDVSRAVSEFKKTLNTDKRLIAVGSEDDRHNVHEIMSQPGSELQEIISYLFERAAALCLISGRMPRVLLNNPTVHSHVISANIDYLGVESVSFVNNVDLMLYEKSVRGTVEGAIEEYDVYDRSDLGDHLDEKFDLAAIHGIEAASDFDLLSRLADSLKSGGRLFISGTGKGRNYFDKSYFSHQFYHMHKLLHGKNGSTFHIVDVGGVTFFVKR